MIVLNSNEGEPLAWNVRPGGNGLRNYIGTVLAHLPDNPRHSYVVWGMASDDNQSWDCFGGDYFVGYDQALEAFADRRA